MTRRNMRFIETEMKFLDKDYIEAKLKEIPKIENHRVSYHIKESDRSYSKTIYINFYIKIKGVWLKEHTLRISDHLVPRTHYPTFLIKPSKQLTPKRKQQFVKVLENAVEWTCVKHFKFAMRSVQKEIKKFQQSLVEIDDLYDEIKNISSIDEDIAENIKF